MTLPAPSALDRAESRLGRTIREKYRIERVLGVGGMATVYLATHRNGSRAALKILHPELAVLDVHRERFVREAYVANSIAHEGAVRVIDDDVAEDNCPFLVMELLEGETLEARRRRFGRLDMREVLVMGRVLCDTLGAAHEAGVVHRDIKPENLFLTKSGSLKILDFGIARVRSEGDVSGTRTGVMMGTPAFMPPEQALGRRTEIDARTDLWALGATLFTLISGRFVHEADSPEEMMVRAATQPSRSIVEVFPDIPLPIARFLARALAFRREDRFPSAYAMRDALVQVYEEVFGETIDTTPMPSGPSSLPASSLRWPRNQSANVETLPAGEAAPENAAPTMVEPSFRGDDAPTLADVSGVQPTVAAPLAETRIEGNPQTQRSGEPIPISRRTHRRRILMSVAALVAAMISVFVGIKHVTGDPVAKKSIAPCSQNTDCSAGLHCDEQRHCVESTACSSNASCVAELGGKPAICRKDTGKCIALETQQCRVLSEKADLQNDDTIWVGAMYPERDKTMDYGHDAMLTIDLARRDFASLTGGLPPIKSGGRSRPLAIVACDDTDDYEKSAEHLINDVGVQSILGFGRSKEVIDLASRYFIPKNILALASNTASMISSIPHQKDQPRMVFRVTTEATMGARTKVALLREIIEPALRHPRGPLKETDSLKIAMLRTDNASGTSHADSFVMALEKSANGDIANRYEVRQFAFEDSMDGGVSPAGKAKLQEIIAFAPHLIVDAGCAHDPFANFEKDWPAKIHYRPWYIIAGGVTEQHIQMLASSHKTAPSRIMAVNPSTALPATRSLLMRYNEFVSAENRRQDINAAPYDAFYLFAYAAMSLGQTPLTGTNLALAIKRLLPPGESIDVGPSGILPAFKALSAGRNIDLGGAQTSLDFDLETGDPAVDSQVDCFDSRQQRSIFGGIYYRARSGHLEGTWKCQ